MVVWLMSAIASPEPDLSIKQSCFFWKTVGWPSGKLLMGKLVGSSCSSYCCVTWNPKCSVYKDGTTYFFFHGSGVGSTPRSSSASERPHMLGHRKVCGTGGIAEAHTCNPGCGCWPDLSWGCWAKRLLWLLHVACTSSQMVSAFQEPVSQELHRIL